MKSNLEPYSAMKDSELYGNELLPEHWDVMPIRRYCRVFAGATPSRAVPEYWQGGKIPWLASGDVNLRRIRSARQFITEAGFSASSTKWISPRSLVMALAGQGRTKGLVATVECRTTCNQSLAAIEPSAQRSDYRYLAYYLESRYLNIRSLVGDGLRDGLNLEHVRAFKTPLPPLYEQAAIVRYLDYVDRRIRKYIRAKKKLIALLNEQKQAVIHRAVTRGLEPNVKMKPSGVEWLGELPNAWTLLPLRRLVSFVTSGSRGWSEYFAESGEIFLQSGNLGRSLELDLSRIQYVRPPGNAEGTRTQVRVGDVLVCITGALTGNVAWVASELPAVAYINQHVALTRPKSNLVNPHFLALALRSELGKNQLKVSEYGGTKQGLGLDDVRSVAVPVPPIDEQNRICDEVSRALVNLINAQSSATQEIEMLIEYRTRLIADVVTGKLDVREAAANLPVELPDDTRQDLDFEGVEALNDDEAPPEEVA